MDYDELKDQAEKLAKGKKTGELAELAFVYSYIANHLTTGLIERITGLEKVVYGIGAVIVVALILTMLSQFFL